MRKSVISVALLIVSAALFSIFGCSSEDNPVAGDGTMNLVAFESTGYGPDSMIIYSGADTCGGDDPNVTVVVPPEEAIWPALIGGGGPECPCDAGMLEISKPVTTRNPSDSLGIFETTFSLPAGIVDPAMHLRVVADDGAEIYLNDHHIGTVGLFGGGDAPTVWEAMISADTLFAYAPPCPPGGEPCSTLDYINFLRFELVNTGTGEYGEPVARADTADCMYVQFESTVMWTVPPQVVIDIKPCSEVNPVNCKGVGNGVIPVAILTTDDFDAMAVDCETVRFGPLGAYETHGKCHVEDVDYDGDMDLVFHFRINETGVTCEDTMMVLWGLTLDGFEFEAWDHITTVPDDECEDCADDCDEDYDDYDD